VVFDSASEAAREFQVTPQTILYRCRNPNFPDYEYVDSSKVNKFKVKVKVKGVVFDSVSEAARQVLVSRQFILRRCRNPKFPDYELVD